MVIKPVSSIGKPFDPVSVIIASNNCQMKTRKSGFFAAALLLGASVSFAFAQPDSEEVPGDNFSLEGALELFKKSGSPKEFEQMLNSPDSKVNNLDLNGDGEIDYIRVIDKNEGNVHAFILQSVIERNEFQDIAVIELEKNGDGSAVLQIVGDADIYGIETIIEPTSEVRVNAGTSTRRATINVWAWPSVQYVYSPYYDVWASPFYWGYYPGWYRPWRPVAFHVYDPWWSTYRPYYSVCYSHRVYYARGLYRPYRSSSVIVYNRHHTVINNYRSSGRGYRYDTSPSRNNRYDSRTSYNSGSLTTGRYDRSNNGSNNSRSNNGGSRMDNNSNSRSGRRSNDSFSTSPSDNSNVRTRQRSSEFNGGRRESTPNVTPNQGGSGRQSMGTPNRSSSRERNPSISNGSSGGSRMSTPSRQGNGGGGSRMSSPPSQSSPRSSGGGNGGGRSGGNGGSGSQSGGRGRH